MRKEQQFKIRLNYPRQIFPRYKNNKEISQSFRSSQIISNKNQYRILIKVICDVSSQRFILYFIDLKKRIKTEKSLIEATK
jgi:hypothetical protein